MHKILWAVVTFHRETLSDPEGSGQDISSYLEGLIKIARGYPVGGGHWHGAGLASMTGTCYQHDFSLWFSASLVKICEHFHPREDKFHADFMEFRDAFTPFNFFMLEIKFSSISEVWKSLLV